MSAGTIALVGMAAALVTLAMSLVLLWQAIRFMRLARQRRAETDRQLRRIRDRLDAVEAREADTLSQLRRIGFSPRRAS